MDDSITSLVQSVLKHKNFKQLAAYSVSVSGSEASYDQCSAHAWGTLLRAVHVWCRRCGGVTSLPYHDTLTHNACIIGCSATHEGARIPVSGSDNRPPARLHI